MSPLKRIAYFFGLPILLIVLWWALSFGSTNFFVPKPFERAQTLWATWVDNRFFDGVVPSLGRLAVGLFFAIGLGILLGLLIGSTRWLRNLLEPAARILSRHPTVRARAAAHAPHRRQRQHEGGRHHLRRIWPGLLNTVEGVRAVDAVLSDSCRSYGTHGLARIRYFVLPAVTPQIMAGVRQSLSIGPILMLISEMFASSSGLGFTIAQFERNFAIPEMWSGIVMLGLIGLIGLIGLGLAIIFQFVERPVLH